MASPETSIPFDVLLGKEDELEDTPMDNYLVSQTGDLDITSLYFMDVGYDEILTAPEEVTLSQRIEKGKEARSLLADSTDNGGHYSAQRRNVLITLKNDGLEAYDELVKRNQRLVINMAKKYRNQGVPFLDLIQEGHLGLMIAADRFDWRRGFKFSTYATWWVRQAITRGLANQSRTMRIPVHRHEKIRKLMALANAFIDEHAIEPTDEELAVMMGLDDVKIAELKIWSRKLIELDKPVAEDGKTRRGEFIEAEGEPVEAAGEKSMLEDGIEELLNGLTAREQRVLELRFGLGGQQKYTLKEIGERWNLTRERIRQIEQGALAKLRYPQRAKQVRDYLI